MAAPIPKNLLPHSAELVAANTPGFWNGTSGAKIADLSFVRFDPTGKIIKTTTGTDIQLSAIMFFDCINSRAMSPADDDTPAEKIVPAFELKQVVTRGSDHYTIEQIDPMYDARKLHHYEILLSGGV